MVKKREQYQPIALIDTRGLSKEEWLHIRKNGPHYDKPDSSDEKYIPLAFGGSDIAAIYDVSPWKTSLELYYEKTGLLELKLNYEKNVTAKKLGNIYEKPIAEASQLWFEENEPNLSVKILLDDERNYYLYRHGKKDTHGKLVYPWALANIDFLIEVDGSLGVFEVKRTDPKNIEVIRQWKAGIVPIYYELQCRHYMAVLNLQFAYIVCAWGHSLRDMEIIRIERNYEIEDDIMSTVSTFVEHVEQYCEPDIDSCKASLLNEFYSKLYGKVDPLKPKVHIPEKYREKVKNAINIDTLIADLKTQLQEAEEKREEVYKDFYPLYKDSDYGTFKLNDKQTVSISLKTSFKRSAIDEEKLKAEQPEVFQKYVIPTFDPKMFKQKEKKFALEYEAPKQINVDTSGPINSFKLSIKENSI